MHVCTYSVILCVCVYRVSELDITPFLHRLNPTTLLADFTVDRNASSCVTPSRNKDIEQLTTFFEEVSEFSSKVTSDLRRLYTHSNQKNFFGSLFSGTGEGC